MDKQFFDITIIFKLKPGMDSDNTYSIRRLEFDEAYQLVSLMWKFHKNGFIDLISITID